MKRYGYWDKESTKSELIESLNKEKVILSTYTLDYLKSLLDLDISVFKNVLTEEELKVLSEYTIYKRIAMYNICNRALNALKQSKIDLDIDTGYIGDRGLEVSLTERDGAYRIFKFVCGEKRPSDSIKDMIWRDKPAPRVIGDVTLFQLQESLVVMKKLRENAKYRLKMLDEEILDRGNPNYLNYKLNNQRQREGYEAYIQELDQRINEGLTDFDLQNIEIVNTLHDKLLEDFGLKESDFDKVAKDTVNGKILVKSFPKLIVSDYKNYM